MSVVVVEGEELRALIRAELRAALAEYLARPEQSAEWLDAKAVATMLGVHTRTVAKLAESKKLPATRIGRLWRFRPEDVTAFLTAAAR